MARPPRLFTIPPSAAFLPTLVEGLLDGRLVEGRRYRDDPVGLADVTVFLPTRRAARALSAALQEALGRSAVLLPRIRPLGDGSEDDDDLRDPVELDLPPAIPVADRLIGLARLIVDWRRHVTAELLLTPAGEAIRVPGSTADALHLASDLLALIDQASAEGIDWSRLSTLVPEDHAAWWQTTLTFLKIATEAWPAHLTERYLADPVERRTRLTDAVAARLAGRGAGGPVIAAGSTGSVPATARLLTAIAGLPDGAVVLPGLDLDLDRETFDGLVEPTAASHPQASMARLLRVMGARRGDVATLAPAAGAPALRSRIVAEAMRPAASTDRWPAAVRVFEGMATETDEALSGLTLVEAANEAEEALAVAIALRESLETPGATAALVTSDRGLARRVAAELERFGVAAADSAGTPLARAPAGILALLACEVVADGFPPEGVVALAKHPLAHFGWHPARCRAAARALELAVLRGPRLGSTAADLVQAAERMARPARTARSRVPALKTMDAAALDDARELARRIARALEPLEALSGGGDLKSWIRATRAAVGAIGRRPEDGASEAVHSGAEVMDRLFEAHLAVEDASLRVEGRDWPACLAALMAGETVRSPDAGSRVAIWGPLEARMMRVDRLVVGGLVEGVWPMATDTGPWLSRPMRSALAFSPPEVRIGLSAHDFTQALGHPDVVLTRSLKREGAPTVPTRFLQRLTALIGKARSTAMKDRGARLVALARRIDDRPAVLRAPRPAPTPPVEARPVQLSVTEIETWIRDPYAIYARRILGLAPLAELGERPDFGTRGSALHEALADFAREWTGPMDETAVARLVEIGRSRFDEEFGAYPEIHALWWPRFEAAAGYLIRSFEAERAVVERLPEVDGVLEVGPGFRLIGRADRVDILPDGRLSIVDFKTGSAPSDRQIATGKAPQLPLEAAMARRGGFSGVPARAVDELVHVILKGVLGRDEVRAFRGYSARDLQISLDETVQQAEERLTGLVRAYRDPERGYLSRAHPFRRTDRGDFDHLARVQEWSTGGDDEGGDS